MEKESKLIFLSFLVIVTLISIASADEWDSLVEDQTDNTSESLPVQTYETPEPQQNHPSQDSSKGETKFTSDFYIALILLAVAALIIAYFAYSFFKKPKNKWEK
ncbi:MAG: hypothetical protein WC494_02635 [Candidatus Pacearchaeota archaeon]